MPRTPGQIKMRPVNPSQGSAWLTTSAAAQRLSEIHHTPVTRESVQLACLRYRQRIEGRISDDLPPNTELAARANPEAGPRELKCTWVPMGTQRWMYLIDPAESNLRHLQLRWPGTYQGPGRKVGGPKKRPAPDIQPDADREPAADAIAG